MNLRNAASVLTLVLAVGSLIAAPALAGDLHLGSKAPDFNLPDQNGKTHKLSDYAGKVVVLEWTNPECPFVQRHYNKDHRTMVGLNAEFSKDDVVWLAIDSSHFVTAESSSKWAQAQGIEFPILLDPSGEVGKAYHAKTTPHMFVIGKDGKILYNGAIDDDPRGQNEDRMNYVAAAVGSALSGEAVETAHTKPYGCSVKYAKKEKADKAS